MESIELGGPSAPQTPEGEDPLEPARRAFGARAGSPLGVSLRSTPGLAPSALAAPCNRLSLAERLPRDRLIELGAEARSARTSAAVSLVIHAQHAGEPVVWIQPEGGSLYPPDLAACGVDLSTLIVVQVSSKAGVRAAGAGGPRIPEKSGAQGLARAAELLLRSGAFGLVVIDLTAGVPRGDAWQGRLASMARQHASRVVILRESSDRSASLGPMIAMRIHATREKRAPGRYGIAYRVLKDKTGLTGDPSPDPRRAPTGLP